MMVRGRGVASRHPHDAWRDGDLRRAIAATTLVDLEWEEASTRLLPATHLTIAGIVEHLAWTEDRWFQGSTTSQPGRRKVLNERGVGPTTSVLWQAAEMVRWVLVLVGALVGGFLLFLAFLVVAMRTKSPRMLGAVRRLNRSVTNRLQRSAGKPGASASLIRHRGRVSGRSYETPIVPFATDDGFLVSLPYGPGTDWVRNVLAQGSAVLVSGGTTYTVDRPEVVATALVEDLFPPSERRTHRVFRVDHCFRIHRVDVGTSG